MCVRACVFVFVYVCVYIFIFNITVLATRTDMIRCVSNACMLFYESLCAIVLRPAYIHGSVGFLPVRSEM